MLVCGSTHSYIHFGAIVKCIQSFDLVVMHAHENDLVVMQFVQSMSLDNFSLYACTFLNEYLHHFCYFKSYMCEYYSKYADKKIVFLHLTPKGQMMFFEFWLGSHFLDLQPNFFLFLELWRLMEIYSGLQFSFQNYM